LLQLRSDYTADFVWIVAKYRACSEEHIRELLRKPSIKKHVKNHAPRIHELLSAWPQPAEEDSSAAVPAAQEGQVGSRAIPRYSTGTWREVRFSISSCPSCQIHCFCPQLRAERCNSTCLEAASAWHTIRSMKEAAM
jgi:hypothetical protein